MQTIIFVFDALKTSTYCPQFGIPSKFPISASFEIPWCLLQEKISAHDFEFVCLHNFLLALTTNIMEVLDMV